MKKKLFLSIIAAALIVSAPAFAQLGGLKDKAKNKLQPEKSNSSSESKDAKSDNKMDVANITGKSSLEGQDTYFPATANAVFYYLKITGLGTDKITVKQFQNENDKQPSKEHEMTKIADNVYNWHNILENEENKLVVVQPDGTLSYLKVGKDFGSYNWTVTLTSKFSEKGKLADDRDYTIYAQKAAKDAYLKIKDGYAKERSNRISPKIKELKPMDNDAAALKMCQEAHTKLFSNPNFDIRNLQFVKAISTKADWKIVKNEITDRPKYRIKDYVVIAKDKTTGQCYAMYNSITQEFAGDWQAARCSTFDEGGGFFVVGDDELKWGIANAIECF